MTRDEFLTALGTAAASEAGSMQQTRAIQKLLAGFDELKIAEAVAEMYHALLTKAVTSYECYVFTGNDPKPEDQWDEYDHMMGPIWKEIAEKMKAAP